MKQKKKQHRQQNKKKNSGTLFMWLGIIVLCFGALWLAYKAIWAIWPQSKPQWAETEVTQTADGEMKPHLEGAQDFLENGGPAASDDPSAEPTPGPEDEEDEDDEEATPEATYNPDADGNGIEDGSAYGIPYSGGIRTPEPTVAPTPKVVYITPEPIPTISFPYAVSGTNLVVEQISAYSGYFLEDGSDRSVSNVAAIVLSNNGNEDLAFAGIGIAQGENSYAFSGSRIPAHSTVILQEQNAAALVSGDFHSCTASTTAAAASDKAAGRVEITDNGDNTFDVANITGETIPEIKVYFKNYLPGEDVYVGGITYSVTLTDVEAGKAATINSDHYASEYSVIVDVTAG